MVPNSYALVTGASSGFGVDFAREFAARGYDLILVARRAEKLREVAEAVRERYGRRVEIVVADLARESERERLHDHVATLPQPVDVLVNNAGLGLYGRFASIPWEKQKAMLDVDISAVVHLTKCLLPAMLERRHGYILNVASTAAYQPTPLYAAYSAAKAFVLSFSSALRFELRDSGVSVTCVSPGISATEFLLVSKQQATLYQRLTMMRSQDVVRSAVDATFARRGNVIPGFVNAMLAALTRLGPLPLLARTAFFLMHSNESSH